MASKKPRNATHEEGKSENATRNTRGKGKSNYRFTKGKDKQVLDKKPGGNDPRWWGTPDYIKSVASFNFASPLGKPIPFSFLNDPSSSVQYKVDSDAITTVPGIMSINFLPTVGIAQSAVDPVNTYIRSVFTKLRSTNNQSAPYQAPDLGMYIMAIDSVHMGIEQLIRMYGIARTYSAMNRYLPNALLRAMGVEPDDATYNLYANLADFRAQILNLMIKIQTLAIPKGINLNERHRELVKYVYKDGESVKAQMYLFRTKYLYKFDETYSESGGGLRAVATPIGGSAAQWISFLHDLIDQLTVSQFFAIVSGDIIKSFGYENLYGMPFFDELYTVVPVYNPEILLEIHNLKVCGDRWSDTAFDITQDAGTNSMISAPYCGTLGASSGCINPIIDVPVDNPDPDMVMIATRLTCVGAVGWDATAKKFKFVPSAIGTELVTSISVYEYTTNGTLKVTGSEANVINKSTLETAYCPSRELFFDWHPHIYNVSVKADHTSVSLISVLSELANYTVMNAGDLSKMHEMAIYGALTVVGVDNVGIK